MRQYVDLHTHSTASDGTLPPARVVQLAKEAGLVGIALTDHDTVAGLPEASAQASTLGLTFVPGIEISAVPPIEDGTLHILGYGIDPQSPVLAEMTRQLMEARDSRNPRMIERLRDIGIDITMPEVEVVAGGDVVGRPHIAVVLMRKGIVDSIRQAFAHYLGKGGKAFIEKDRLAPRRAIELIHQSGGVAVVAHAIQLGTTNNAQLDRAIKDLADQGLDGIEVIHSDHNDDWIDKCQRLAKRYGLLMTGGSDFHGTNKSIPIGIAHGKRVPREFMDTLLERIT